MTPPYITPNPNLALPSQLSNGEDHAAHCSKGSTLRRPSVNTREREALTASIKSSHSRRQPIHLDPKNEPQRNGHGPYFAANGDTQDGSTTMVDVAPRDPRDEAPQTLTSNATCPASPYTLNPPIDFDGLSWPSELSLLPGKLNRS